MRVQARIFLLGTLSVCAALCAAQTSNAFSSGEGSALGSVSSMHDYAQLNLIGAEVHMPAFDDTILGTNNDFRRALLRHGMALRVNSAPTSSFNLLDPPASAEEQAYIGQRPYVKGTLNPILTMDLKALHLRSAQLYLSGAMVWTTWEKSGPPATALNSLYFYKSFGEGRVEIKAGYMVNAFEFVGFHVGGSLSTSTQGVYAVLPYNAGLSYSPLGTPSFNLKWNTPEHFYLKGALQRSTDPKGGPATIRRNQTGLRFMPKGDKLVTIAEGGYDRPATKSAVETWVRMGLIRNTSKYANSLTGGTSSGNYCAYLLADRQITRGFTTRPSSGLYLGGSAEIAPARLNAYTRYYEARAYFQGPLRSRPTDLVSFIATRSAHSQDTLRNLIAQGKTVWTNTNTVTASYSMHAMRGTYFSGGLTYLQGPAVTPRAPNALVISLGSSLFF
jgi:porin